jgi:hypothetical protein
MQLGEQQAGEDEKSVNPQLAVLDQVAAAPERVGELGVKVNMVNEDPGREEGAADGKVRNFLTFV